MIHATWCISNNVGDTLTTWLVNKLSGESPIYVPRDSCYRKLVACGSILNWADKNSMVWGAGVAAKGDGVAECDIRAVRGPLSAAAYAFSTGQEAPTVHGDPALLCPQFYNPEIPVTHDCGIIPHYINQHEIIHSYEANAAGLLFINVFDPLETIVDKIKSCTRIISSSLHGIILAHAYGVPALWIQCYDNLGGDDTKFHDYFLSLDIQAVPTPWYVLKENLSAPAKFLLPGAASVNKLRTGLLNSYPYERK